MSLAQMIRRVAGGKPRSMADERPDEELEDEETTAETDDTDTTAEDDGPEKEAEDEGAEPEDGDEEPAAEDDGDKDMPAKEKAAFAKGRKAERKRIGAILGSSHADANPGLAAHLAFQTADSPKKALATLKFGGKSAAGLSDRMNARGASRTGRGGEADVRGKSTGSAWDNALAKAGKLKGK